MARAVACPSGAWPLECAPRRLQHIAMNRASMLFWRKLIAASIHSLCDNKDVYLSGIAVSWIETLLAVMA